MMETMPDLIGNKDTFYYEGYFIKNIYDRWYIASRDKLEADFATLEECRYWIGER